MLNFFEQMGDRVRLGGKTPPEEQSIDARVRYSLLLEEAAMNAQNKIVKLRAVGKILMTCSKLKSEQKKQMHASYNVYLRALENPEPDRESSSYLLFVCL